MPTVTGCEKSLTANAPYWRQRTLNLELWNSPAILHELRGYVESLTGDIKKMFVVHGEESQAMAFAETLRAMKPKAEVFVPEYKQSATV